MRDSQVYVLSTGRTGSTYLSLLLKEIVPALNFEHQKRGARLINIYSNLPLENKYYLSVMEFLFQISGRGMPPKPTVDPLLSGGISKLISHDFLDAKVIHLVRNPSKFVESFMNWKNQSLKKKILHHGVPFWNPVPFIFDEEISYREWLGMEKFEKFCWIWNYKNRNFCKLKENNEYLLLRFEDITSKDDEIRNQALTDLSSFVGASQIKSKDLFNSKVNKSEKKYFPAYQNWDDSMKESVKRYCGDFAKDLGYVLD